MRLFASGIAFAAIFYRATAIDIISNGNYLATKRYVNNICSGNPDAITLVPVDTIQACSASAVTECVKGESFYNKQSCANDIALVAEQAYPGLDVKQLQKYTDFTCSNLSMINLWAATTSESYSSECNSGGLTAYLRKTNTLKTNAPAATPASGAADAQTVGVVVAACGLAIWALAY